jgi:hypothetical protein
MATSGVQPVGDRATSPQFSGLNQWRRLGNRNRASRLKMRGADSPAPSSTAAGTAMRKTLGRDDANSHYDRSAADKIRHLEPRVI